MILAKCREADHWLGILVSQKCYRLFSFFTYITGHRVIQEFFFHWERLFSHGILRRQLQVEPLPATNSLPLSFKLVIVNKVECDKLHTTAKFEKPNMKYQINDCRQRGPSPPVTMWRTLQHVYISPYRAIYSSVRYKTNYDHRVLHTAAWWFEVIVAGDFLGSCITQLLADDISILLWPSIITDQSPFGSTLHIYIPFILRAISE